MALWRHKRSSEPPELDRRELSSALGSVFRDIEDVYGFTVRAGLGRVDGELDEVAPLALYRIVQEAVGNAVRHAGVNVATVISICDLRILCSPVSPFPPRH